MRSHVALWFRDHAVWIDVCPTYGNWMEVVRVGIVFAGVVMSVLVDGRMGGQPFQPLFIAGVQAPFMDLFYRARPRHAAVLIFKLMKSLLPA